MRNFQKIVTPCLLALAFILAAPAQAQNPRLDLELVPTGAMPDFSGAVAIYPSRNGSENVAIRVDNSAFKDGTTVRVTVLRDGEELDVAVMTFELGSAYFHVDNYKDDPSPVFPTAKIRGFIVYFKNTPVLEVKVP